MKEMNIMARARLVPSEQELKRMLERGFTHDDIVAHVWETERKRVHRSTVSAAISRAGLSQPQNRYVQEIPWRVNGRHLRDYQPRMLRLLGRRRSGETLNDLEESRLNNWLQMLEADNSVVAYDPEVGFGYVDRSPEDPVDTPIHATHIKFIP